MGRGAIHYHTMVDLNSYELEPVPTHKYYVSQKERVIFFRVSFFFNFVLFHATATH